MTKETLKKLNNKQKHYLENTSYFIEKARSQCINSNNEFLVRYKGMLRGYLDCLAENGFISEQEKRILFLWYLEKDRTSNHEPILNEARQYVLDITPINESPEETVQFSVCDGYFSFNANTETEMETDFDEVLVTVPKFWLLHLISKSEQLQSFVAAEDFLQNEYTSDDSICWYEEAVKEHKICAICFA